MPSDSVSDGNPPVRRRRCVRLAKVSAIALGIVAIAYAGLFLFALFCSGALIFKPPVPSYTAESPGVVNIPLSDGCSISALWLPKPEAKTALLYFHGNSHDLGRLTQRLERMRDFTGCAVLAVDYPGYGLSAGEPSEAGTYRAADAAFDRLVHEYGYSPENIVIRGSSLGSGPAVHVASLWKVKGVILDAPFTSIFRIVTFMKVLPFDRFDNLALIGKVRSPLLVIHGDRDRVVPFYQGKALLAAAVNAPIRRFLRMPGAGHEIVDAGSDRLADNSGEIMKIVEGR